MTAHGKQSFTELVDMGYRYEAVEEEEQQEAKEAKGNNNNNKWKRKKNFQNKKPTQGKSGIRCFKCQKMGHYSNECKQPSDAKKPKLQGQGLTCYNCHKPAHFAKECPVLQKANVA